MWSLLNEIFGPSEFILRFQQLTFRPLTYAVGRGPRWAKEPGENWRHSLRETDKIIAEAVEEGGVPAPSTVPEPTQPRRPLPNVVVNVHNENVFSPTVHISVAQLLDRLDALPLSSAERELAAEQLRELEAETQGQGRWPLIARSLESMKAIGKSVYKDIAVPLLVEYLKRESGLR